MYILRNFNDIAITSDEILNLSYEDFYQIISDDILNVKDEEPVWECCLRWLEHDTKNRLQYVQKLLSGVRLGLMNMSVNTQNYCIILLKLPIFVSSVFFSARS